MKKQEFLEMLFERLSGLPQVEREERLTFYSEMIDDRIEDGLSEAEAVWSVGTIDEIVGQITKDHPNATQMKKEQKSEKRRNGWEILLLILGSPVWLPLFIAAIAVILSLYVCVWSIIISLWAVFASVAACSVAGILAGGIFAIRGYGLSGFAVIGAALVCAGVSIFMYFACKMTTKGILKVTKKCSLWGRSAFAKRRCGCDE